jgi:hypothetical protein
MRLGAGALVAAIGDAVAPFGMNLIGVARPAAYDALVPASHRLGDAGASIVSIVVVGNGGGGLWSAFRDHVAAHPDVAKRPHPLDDFTRGVIEDAALPALAPSGVTAILRLPFDHVDPLLSFAHLAAAAGLGRPSLLGVLVHPEFGPWMALRGALLLDVATGAARPAAGFDPCVACVERPCIAACPSAAISAAGWDVERCATYRVSAEGRCDDACHARVACVYGHEHRYPPEARAYHQAHARAVMQSHQLQH